MNRTISYTHHSFTVQEAKERDIEFDSTGYNSNSPNSSMTGGCSSDLLPESPSSSSISTEQSPESPKISPSMLVDVKKPVFGTIQTRNGPMVFSVLAPGTLANLTSTGKKPVVIKSTFFRHVRFSVKYFGREVSSWNFRAKSMCRLTSEKKPMDVKYPNPIYNERKMSKVSLC